MQHLMSTICFFIFVVVMFVLQKLPPRMSSEYETLPDEEDLSEEVYYSDEDADNILPRGDAVTNAASHVENLPNPPPTEVRPDPAALLSQLANGEFPSQATIQFAVTQLLEALTAEEKQLMTQLVQQMILVNPVLGATNPLALQVEAIRIILTTRGQVALLLGQPALQQMALQTQLQNLPQSVASPGATAALEPTGTMTQAESCPVPAAVNHQDVANREDVASLAEQRHLSDQAMHRVPVQQCGDSVTLVTDRKYPDECSSMLSDHVQLEAGPRTARGRGLGRGRSLSGLQNDDEMCRQDRPRGRGLRRAKTGTCVADKTSPSRPGNSSASVHQPLVPPPLHSPQPVRQSSSLKDETAVDGSENWEEEIDEFGPGMFRVESSFFKSGKR